ncbi:phenylacetate--CoA ligase family protein [Clostridia bacterium]|nr:phenylacetate--CoA ligase family protein [Clostridia bacterium]
MANLEAYRRIRVRRGGDYQADYQSLDLLEMLQENQEEKQLLLLNELLSYIGKNIPYYQEKDIPKQVEYLSKLSDLPIMNKEILRGESVRLINENHRSALWKGWTSGSTGSSLHYHRDKHSMRYEYALYERLYEFACQQENPIRARLSNVVIAKPGAKPPYWFYLRAMRQLQCSTDHIEPSTAALYLEALARYGVVLGTGYTYSWLRLAEGVLNLKERSNPLKAIVTDSEGITLSQKKVVEEAFSCPVYQTYGSSELGMVAVQCEKGHYHLLDRIHVEVVDSQGRVLPYGEEGEIVVTDLRSFDAPFLRYRSGDLGILEKDGCGCKWKGPYLSSIAGRVEDYVVTSKGVRMTRVNRIVKGVEGIKAMQIVQDKPGQLHVRVIPDEHFCPEEMKKMHKKGESFMGKIDFSWELVETLETTASGKVRYLIRNFEA